MTVNVQYKILPMTGFEPTEPQPLPRFFEITISRTDFRHAVDWVPHEKALEGKVWFRRSDCRNENLFTFDFCLQKSKI